MERPRYSVTTAAELVRKESASSATAVTFVGFAMIASSLGWVRPLVRRLRNNKNALAHKQHGAS